MSAYIVDREDIDTLVTAAVARSLTYDYHGTPRHVTEATADDVGRLLWVENLTSVAARYPNDVSGGRTGPCDLTDEEIRTYRYPAPLTRLDVETGAAVGGPSAQATIELIRCYQYQSCEHEEWAASEARALTEALKAACEAEVPAERERREAAMRAAQATRAEWAKASHVVILHKRPPWARALIVARLDENSSDYQSDYFAHRTARTVAIGWRKAARESFAEMRKAAATFAETAHLAPGHDDYTARVVIGVTFESNGRYYSMGEGSHWHDAAHFTTEGEAVAYVARQGAPAPISFEGALIPFEWRIDRESVEHREKWSMGDGYYLKSGHGDANGWRVEAVELYHGARSGGELVEHPFNGELIEDHLPEAEATTGGVRARYENGGFRPLTPTHTAVTRGTLPPTVEVMPDGSWVVSLKS